MLWTVVLEKTLESPLDSKEIQPVHPKGNQSWVFIGRTDAETPNTLATLWEEELTHLKRPWCWERLKTGGEGDDRGWDGWMASLTWWTWVWASFGSWWWTRKLGALESMGLQGVRHDWVTELNWTEPCSLGRHCTRLSLICWWTLGLSPWALVYSAALNTCLQAWDFLRWLLWGVDVGAECGWWLHSV